MAIFLFTANFPGLSGLPEDVIVNTFHFEGGGADPGNVVDMIDDFYITVPTAGGTSTIASYMSNDSVDDTYTIRGYDLSDPIPRIPVIEESRSLVGLGTTEGLPRELAICASYQATRLSGVNQARRRGRLYIGGLGDAANIDGMVQTAYTTTISRKMSDLRDAAIASVSWSWVVYSPTSSSAAVVDNGWVDNAWDVQRRRGVRPTVRTPWS